MAQYINIIRFCVYAGTTISLLKIISYYYNVPRLFKVNRNYNSGSLLTQVRIWLLLK